MRMNSSLDKSLYGLNATLGFSVRSWLYADGTAAGYADKVGRTWTSLITDLEATDVPT